MGSTRAQAPRLKKVTGCTKGYRGLRSVAMKSIFALMATSCAAYPPTPEVRPREVLTQIGDRTMRMTPSGQPVHWDALPIQVQVSADAWSIYGVEILAAMSAWDYALDTTVFEVIFDAAPAAIVVMDDADFDAACARSEVACTVDSHWTGTGRISTPPGARFAAIVILSSRLDSATKDRVIVHELGHLLGLDHDVWDVSVMYRAVVDIPWIIDPDDIAALRKVYRL